MAPDAQALLWDAQQAAQRVGRFIAGKGFDHYLADELLRAGVERQFSIIGEALAQLRKVDPATAATLPSLPKAIGLRNVLVHGYASVDHRIVWGVVQSDLVNLQTQLDTLLRNAP